MFSTMSYIKTALAVLLLHITCILAQCPPGDLILPCNCTPEFLPVVQCSKITDMEVLRQVFDRSGDRRFHFFGLSESTLSYLPAKAVTSKQFHILMIVNSAMISLFDADPVSDNVVKGIMLENVKFQRGVGWELFKNLKVLIHVKAENTEIKSLGRKFVENINPGLTNLVLEDTKLKKIYPNAFQKLDKLYNLEIRNSFVRELKRSMFATPSALQTFDFSGNLIESLPSDIFSGMPKLSTINLDNNKISTVSEVVFRNTQERFHYITLENNPLVCDCSLRWFLNREHQSIVGICDSPGDKKGRKLDDLKAADFNYCD